MKLFYPTRLFFLMAILLVAFAASAQQRGPAPTRKTKTEKRPAAIISPFEVQVEKSNFNQVVKDATYLKLDEQGLKSALAANPREILFRIPQKNGKNLELLLERQEILTPDFKVTNEKGMEIPFRPGKFYTGKVLDRRAADGSMASLSVVGDEVMAMINLSGDNFVLGTLRDGQNKRTADYVLYKDENLQIPNSFSCGTEMAKHQLQNNLPDAGQLPVAKNVVKVYFEADYRTFLDKGSSVSNVANYLTGLFNMVATIYHKENIVTQISQIGVWTVPDPYPINSSNGSGAVLNAFRVAKNGGFNGDLAHLISTKPVGHGGIAWMDVLCYPTIGYRTAYSNISTGYNNFPLYSWTIDVVTHEMGHNLGSPHTHDCVWGPSSNQALDNCAAPSGGCATGPAPANGGTVMSYCHMTAAGKNFNLGFGAQPGNLIRSRVNAATCLSQAFLSCSTATPIYCGVPLNSTTIGAANNVNTYGCKTWLESGGEKVFLLHTTETSTITATLSNLTADLDVIILDACSENNCLAEGNNTATVANASPGQYFIVVDGYNGAAGDFTLTVNCEGYCFTTGLTNYEYIEQVQIGSIDNTSGNNYGYADFTAQKTALQRGGAVDVKLTPGFISGAWNERWGIWIDLNQDEDFNDFGEQVFDSGAAGFVPATGTMYIPSYALLGETRMRVAMRYALAPTDCGSFNGEVEDYTVVIEAYCPSLGNTSYEFIDAIKVGDYVNPSGNNGGYADFTTIPYIELVKGTTVPLKLTPGFTGAYYPETWKVWIDYNLDYDFDDVGELVYTSASGNIFSTTGYFTVPADAATTYTRMRITMQYDVAPGDCSYAFWGETEDYTVRFLPACPSAGNATYEFIDKVGIGSLFSLSGNNGGYADLTSIAFNAKKGEYTGVSLIPGFAGSAYQEFWRIWIDFNDNHTFEDSELILEAGPSNTWIGSSFTLSDTLPSGTFGLRVSMGFGGFPPACGNIGWGEVEDYLVNVTNGRTGSPLTGNVLTDRNSDGGQDNSGGIEAGDFVIFPNPVRDVLRIDWNSFKPQSGQIVSARGQVIEIFGQAQIPDEINVRHLPNGVYILRVSDQDNTIVSKRFVKINE